MKDINFFYESASSAEKLFTIIITFAVIIVVLNLLSKIAKELIINSVLGLGLVWVLKYFGLWKFSFTFFTYILILFGGVPGVILIYILDLLGIRI